MNNKYIAPFITCCLLLVFDVAVLIQGLIQRQNLRIALAALGLMGIIYFIYYLLLCNNTNRLKPVRVRARR